MCNDLLLKNATVRVLAKQVVTIRAQKERLQKSHAQLNGLKTAGSTMAANLAVSQAMSGTAKVMAVVNANNSMESLQSSMADMQRSMAMTEFQEDMLDELLLGSDSEEEMETDDVLSQVFDEIGLDLRSDLVDAPTKSTGSALGSKSPSVTARTKTGAAAAARPSASFLAKSSSSEEFKPLTAQEEAEAEQLLAELGV